MVDMCQLTTNHSAVRDRDLDLVVVSIIYR